LDDGRITQAIDARGPWFYSLKRQPLREPKVIFLKDQAWGKLDEVVNEAAEKLATGVATTAEEASKLAGQDLGDLLKNVGGIVTSIIDLARTGKCMSRHFDIIEKNGALTLYSKL